MIKFSSYMDNWLYGEKGYYSNMPKIGKDGDFYTSSSISMFFGGSIANRIIQTIQEGFLSQNATIIEVGAHKGYLLADLIQFIYTLKPQLLDSLSFVVIEPFKKVRIAQTKYFTDCFQERIKIDIIDDFTKISCKEAFIISNEIFDSFSCEVISDGKMLYVDKNEVIFDEIDENILKIAKKYSIKKGEIPVNYSQFIEKICNSCKKFEAIFFDYGQMKPRNDMSIRIYSKHKVYPFFELTSLVKNNTKLSFNDFIFNSDLTYDVIFSYLVDEFEKFDVKMFKFDTQMKILVDFGLIELLKILYENIDEKAYSYELNKAKQLIDPNFFGEKFKGIVFRR